MDKYIISPKIDSFSSNSLDAYIQKVKRIPVLSIEEEQKLAKTFYYYKDVKAAKQLVISNLRFVAYIAQGYANYGLAMSDLIQEGNIGLMKAVKRFNPEMKVRLISFAVYWIKAEIQEFVLKNWRIVKMATTKAKRKLFFNLRKMKKRLGWANAEEINTVAKTLGVQQKTVKEMEMHLSTKDMSFANDNHDTTQEENNFANRLPTAAFSDMRYDPAQLVENSNFSEWNNTSLKNALKKLDKRSYEIIVKRWLQEPKIKLKDLAPQYNLSMERIRQVEQHAIQSLKTFIENEVAVI